MYIQGVTWYSNAFDQSPWMDRRRQDGCGQHSRRLAFATQLQIVMNNLFLPTSRHVLPIFQTFCPVGVQIAQTVVRFAHFQVQARKRGVLGWAWGCFVYLLILERGVWRLSKEQGLGVVFWAKWDPIWAKWNICTKSGQKCSRIGEK